MKRSYLGGAMALLLAQPAFADPGLSMQLQLISRSEQADHFLSQYEVTLTNTGTVPLSTISMIPSDPDLSESALGANEIQVTQLAAGTQHVAYWDLKTYRSMAHYIESQPIHFNVAATDTAGETISLSVVTEEQPLP